MPPLSAWQGLTPAQMNVTQPITPVAPSVSPTGPTFQDVMARLQNPGYGVSTTAYTNATNAVAPTAGGIDPTYQNILDIIKKQQDYATGVGVANAQSLAAKRGLTGSSIEQFGTAQAGEAASRAAQDATAATLQNAAAQQLALRQQQSQIFGNQGQTYAQIAGNAGTTGAQLTSDEIASLRNQQYAQQYLQLQQQLGQQGLDVSQQNINAQKDIAGQQQRNALLQTGATIAAPYLFNSLGIGGGGAAAAGGGTPGFFGGGGTGSIFNPFSAATATSTAPSLLSGTAYTGGAGTPASSLFPGGLGPVGTGSPGMFGAGGTLFNTAGTSALGAGDILPGVAGWQAGTHVFGDNRYTNTGGIVGGVAGSLFGPAGAAAGGFVGTAAGKYGDQANTSLQKSVGNTGAAVLKPFVDPIGTAVDLVSNPGKKISQAANGLGNTANKAVNSVSNSISKAFGGGSKSLSADQRRSNEQNDIINQIRGAGTTAAKQAVANKYLAMDKAKGITNNPNWLQYAA